MALMIGAHAVGGSLQSIATRSGSTGQRLLQLVLTDFQRSNAGGREAIKTVGVFQHRSIATRLDVGQDARSGAIDGFVFAGFKGQDGRQLLLEAGFGGIQFSDGYAHDVPLLLSVGVRSVLGIAFAALRRSPATLFRMLPESVADVRASISTQPGSQPDARKFP